MRITIDLDSKSQLGLAYSLAKGLVYLRKLPTEARNTERGIHLIYRGIDLNDEIEVIRMRRLLFDDENRIRLDSLESGKPKQVLFREKEVICKGFIHRAWMKKVGAVNRGICRCHKRVIYSRKIWSESEKKIEIAHQGSICTFPLTPGIPAILRLLPILGVKVDA